MRDSLRHFAAVEPGRSLRGARLWGAAVIAGLLMCLAPGISAAQSAETKEQGEQPPAEKRDDDKPAESGDDLTVAEEQIRGKYQRFEQVLLRMSELTAASDPKRAALLRKAVSESKDKLIAVQFDRLVEALRQDRLANAVTQQAALEQDLGRLLELLLTEQRGQQLKDERERVKAQIRELKELINKQQQLQAQTAGKGDPKNIAEGQGKLAKQTGKLADEMKQSENDRKPQAAEAESEDGESQKPPQDGDQSEKNSKPREGEEKPEKGDQPDKAENQDKPDGKPEAEKEADEDSSKKPESGKAPKAGGKAMPGQRQQGQNQQGQNQEQDQQQQNPAESSPQEAARKRVEAAEQRMQEAKQKLDKAQREGAAEEQEQAVRELELAKAKLEEILRQLREEELLRTLAQLESRFRKMLEMQVAVYDSTKLLAGQDPDDRDRNDEIEAGRLSRKEAQIVVEVDAAQIVLREEGSAVAFPEAVSQMREDMEQVVTRLGQAKADDITVGIEEEIIAALEEMIAALQKAQKDQEEKQQQQQQQQGEPQDPPLVDALAELKMIRSLQMRVNNRTARYGKLVEGELGQADRADLIEALQKLSERETRIFKATRDIVLEKNK